MIFVFMLYVMPSQVMGIDRLLRRIYGVPHVEQVMETFQLEVALKVSGL